MKSWVVIPLLTSILMVGLRFTCTGGELVPTQGPRVEAPYVKLIQPAFLEDYAQKVVSFQASFYSMQTSTFDLPQEYKDGYVRFMLCSESKPITVSNITANSCDNPSINFIIPKSDSDAVFSLKQSDRVAIVAEAIPERKMQRLLFVVKSIKTP